MQALILAGGEGTRLRPLTSSTPKPVISLVNKPFLTYMLRWLHIHGVDEAIISCGYMAEKVRAVLGDRSCGLDLRYVDEDTPLGTAGAIKNAENYLGQRFLALNGDVLTDMDLTALIGFHEKSDAVGTIALTPVADPSNYGLVKTGEEGDILEFLEKPKPEEIDTDLINAGAYVLEKKVLDLIPEQENVSIERQIFPKLIGRGLYAWEDRNYWLDIGTPERYLQATYDIIEQRVDSGEAQDKSGAIQDGSDDGSGRIVVGDGTEVSSNTRLVGPSSIGSGCEIGPGVVIERAVIHDNCMIGSNSTISESVIGTGARVGEESCIEQDAVVGSGARIGNGRVVSSGSRIEEGAELSEGAVVGKSDE